MKNYLIDMDGVLVHGRTPIPGADQFIQRLRARGVNFLVLTNNPLYTPGDLAYRLHGHLCNSQSRAFARTLQRVTQGNVQGIEYGEGLPTTLRQPIEGTLAMGLVSGDQHVGKLPGDAQMESGAKGPGKARPRAVIYPNQQAGQTASRR